MKKIIFLVAIILFSIKTNAQNNLYPVEDPWFLSYLQANYPQTIVNDSLDIDATAGIDTLDLPFTATSFTNIDPIQFFNDLTYLNCWGQDITSLPELPDGLKVLRCASNELTSLPELPNGLIWLSCGLNQLTSLPELPDALGILMCNQNNLTSLPLLPQNLSVITFFGNPLECVSNHLTQFPELNVYPICYGCTDPLYLEYEALAADDDGSCATLISVGCMDVNADNYDESANVSGACDYSCPFTANGTNYLDGLCYDYVWTYGYTVEELEGLGYDCSCVENPFYGCMDSVACNYDAEEGGLCEYPNDGFDCLGNCIIDIDCSGICGGNSFIDDCGECIATTVVSAGLSYPVPVTTNCEIYPISPMSVSSVTAVLGASTSAVSDAYIFLLDMSGATLADLHANPSNYENTSVTVDFEIPIYVSQLQLCSWWNPASLISLELQGAEGCVAVLGCIDSEACNYDAEANEDDGSCVVALEYYDCNGVCLNDTDNDSVCDELEISGCIDTMACNYDANATDDDASCTYADTYYDCNGICINDTDIDNVCDELEISGCIDTMACNYDANATDDDASCTYADTYYDCNGICINDIDFDGECDELDYDDGIGIDEVGNTTQTLIKMIDILGREQKEHKQGTLLFYIYDNGRVEKRLGEL
jgi:hypothetical protein